jgi:hypothetical protein
VFVDPIQSLITCVGDDRRKLLERRRQLKEKKKIAKRKRAQEEQQAEEAIELGNVDVASMSLDERIKYEKMMEKHKKREEKLKKRKVDNGHADAVGFSDSTGIAKDTSVNVTQAVHTTTTKANSADDVEMEKIQPRSNQSRSVLDNLVIGINDITSTLDEMAALFRTPNLQLQTTAKKPVRVVFVCKEDVSTPQLYAHLPTMIYLAGLDIRLCPLPIGAEAQVAHALGIRRVVALAVKVSLNLRVYAGA